MLYPEIDLGLTESIGRYGRLWKRMMLERRPEQVSALLLRGAFHATMQQVDRIAESAHEDMMQAFIKARHLPDMMDWQERAAYMAQLSHTACEIICLELGSL